RIRKQAGNAAGESHSPQRVQYHRRVAARARALRAFAADAGARHRHVRAAQGRAGLRDRPGSVDAPERRPGAGRPSVTCVTNPRGRLPICEPSRGRAAVALLRYVRMEAASRPSLELLPDLPLEEPLDVPPPPREPPTIAP